MEIRQKICEETVDDDKLNRLESSLGNKLPRSYREFLKKYNGGKPKLSKFIFVSTKGKQEDSTVHYFFAVYDGKIGNIERNFGLFKGRIPNGYLPIACDPFGNLILMPMLNQSDAPIYFWDHEKESDALNVAVIEDSFEKFIANLK